MKKLNYLLLLGCYLIVFVCSSCEVNISTSEELEEVIEELEGNNETVDNQFIYQEMIYPLEEGYLYYFGNNQAKDFFYGIRLHSASITYNETTQDYEGTGDIVSIELYSPTQGIGEGIYYFDENEDSFTFSHAAIGIHYNVDENTGSIYDVKNGSIQVKKDAEETHFIFDFTLADGSSVTGQFKGALHVL